MIDIRPFAEIIGRNRKVLNKITMFVGYIIAVEYIGVGERVSRRSYQAIPFLVGRNVQPVWLGCLDNQHPWAMFAKVHPSEHAAFMTFNVYLQKVDLLRRMIVANLR